MYVSREQVSASEENKKGVVKQLTFGRLPQCLCLHIQRTAFERGVPSKRNDHVSFPESLDMGRYAYASQAVKSQELERKSREWAKHMTESSEKEGEVKLPPLPLSQDKPKISYNLRSVVVHLGAINSGHYLTYRKGPVNGKMAEKWFLTSDEKVEETNEAVVKSSSAYMLFYEREEPLLRVMSPD